MFGFSQNNKLLAVADGRAVPLDEVSDEVFASGMLGGGFAVQPISGNIYSPVDGEIVGITESKHAFTIKSDDGLDVLVHIGIDTVKLGGNGFTPMVREGERVKAGGLIARVELSVIRGAGYDTVIPVVITNSEDMSGVKYRYGDVKGGKSAVISYQVRRSAGINS